MPPQDSENTNQAPRCQHIRAGGGRCKLPARRGERLCQFHHVVAEIQELDRMLAPNGEAVALQLALWQVMRVVLGPAPDYEACRAMLYALQTCLANRKNFEAERRERARSSNPQSAEKEKGEETRSGKSKSRTWIH